MTSSRYSEITDELLSAYIDNVVTERERELVEEAAREDAAIAWRLATLRDTVQLLHKLPLLQAPRSFVLTAEQLGKVESSFGVQPPIGQLPKTPQGAGARTPVATPTFEPGVWAQMLESWRRFWRGGSPVWRNAMAASLAALLVLLVLPTYLAPSVQQPAALTASSSESVMEVMPAAAVEGATSTSAPPLNEAAKAPASAPEIATAADVTERAPAMATPLTAQEDTTMPAAPAAVAAVTSIATTDAAAVRIIPSEDSREEDALALGTGASAPSSESDMLAGIAAAPAPPMEMAPAAAESVLASDMTTRSLGEQSAARASAAITISPAQQQLQRSAEPDTAVQVGIGTENSEQGSPEQPAVAAAPVETPVEMPAVQSVTTSAIGADEPGGAPPTDDKVATAPTVAANTDMQTATTAPAPASPAVEFLPWLQLAAALAAVGFALLWWYSRRHPQTGS